jgi:hypothetical protein
MLNADGSAYVDELAISPVDHVIYATAHRDTIVQMLLSRDGGLTWDMVLEEAAPAVGCWHGVTFLRAHAVDPARVLRVAGCSYGGAGIANVDVSADQMATWESHGQPSIAGIDTGIFGLIGLEGVRPERLYATTFHSRPTGLGPTQSLGRSVFRSDDEGRTWTQLLSTVKPGVEEDSRSIVGVAYDPRTPDWVFVAMPTGVKLSRDAGRTWSDFRRQDLPEIKSIVVGIDGRNLYAATEKGVFRLNLPV